MARTTKIRPAWRQRWRDRISRALWAWPFWMLPLLIVIAFILSFLGMTGCATAKSEITPANVSINQHEQRPITIEETTTTTTIRRASP